jgi:hypothetical protein
MLRNGLRIARVTAVLAVLCVVGLTNAQPETFMPTDPGLESVSTLVTEIDITEYSPYDDINVTVDWAYADGHRIIVVWTIEHDNQLSYHTPVPTLTGEDGQSFPLILHEYNRGVTAGGSEDRTFFINMNTFDASGITGEPEVLALTAGFTFEALPEERATTGSVIKPFSTSVAFEVPFIPAQKLEGEYIAEESDIALRLSDVSYTPSSVVATLCYPSSASAMPLSPYVFEEELYEPMAYFRPDETPREDGLNCGEFVAFFQADTKTGILTLTIERLQTDPIVTEARAAHLRALISEAGLPVEVFTGPNVWGEFDYYTDFTAEIRHRDAFELMVKALNTLETQAMRDTIEGPWIFEIDLNE